MREILDEASQVVVYSHRLEQKSRELEAATAELREANERLKELDRLKDDFVSTVTHELRTPLTSIRAFTEILLDDPDVELGQRKKFLGIITKETERLTRLINQVLDLAKIESGKAEWVESARRHEGGHLGHARGDGPAVQGKEHRGRGAAAGEGLRGDRRPRPHDPGHAQPAVERGEVLRPERTAGSRSRCPRRDGCLRVDVRDNGRGISPEDQAAIFSKFRQVGDTLTDKPHGSGLGLHISRQIVEHFGGRMWVESGLGARRVLFVHAADAEPEGS